MQSHWKTLVIGHRGASADAPENTLSAFKEAFFQGADGVEGDFHLTSDSVVVCIHDADTLRTAGTPAIVAESSLVELRKLEFGSWKGSRFSGEPIPALGDLLEIIPAGSWLVIELKTGKEIVAPLVYELRRNPKAQLDRILVIAFDEHVIAEIKRLLPEVLAHWLTDYHWDSAGKWTPDIETILETIQRCGADGLGSENRPEIVTADFVNRLKAAGIQQFHVWTVDSPDQAGYYRDLGAFAVTSNHPGLIVESFRDPCRGTAKQQPFQSTQGLI